jgi:hypothetical protein
MGGEDLGQAVTGVQAAAEGGGQAGHAHVALPTQPVPEVDDHGVDGVWIGGKVNDNY